jgi:mycofactocin precursor
MPAVNTIGETGTDTVAETVANQGTVDEVLVDEVLVDEVLVEEVSIDGMCGVY